MCLFNSDLLKRNSTLNVFTSVSLAVLIAGCGSESNPGGEQGPVVPPTESASISAQYIQNNSLVGQSHKIDLTDHIHTSDNQGYIVTGATSLSGNTCQVQGAETDGFYVYSSDVNDCLFEYEVATQDYTSTATLYARVAMGQNYASVTLPRITASTIESQVVVVNLDYELGNSFPSDDFQLQDSLVTIGSGTARVSGLHQIEFTPTAKGQTEVYYSYQNGESIQQGSISIATSESTYNTAPEVSDFAYDHLALLGESVVVDVKPYILDIDGDDVQLVGVQDFNSTTSLFDAISLTNTQFVFYSTAPGPHDVAYTVSDHMGGYATGIVRIEVEPDFSLIQDWEDIVTHDPVINSDIRFFAPMTKLYADYVNASYTGTFVEDGTQGLKDAEIVTQTLSQARQYCKTRGGRLPLQRELETLVMNETSAFNNHNWPTSKKYWTADKAAESNGITVNLNDGVVGDGDRSSERYTTCVDLSNPSVSDFSVSADYIDGTGNQYQYDIQVVDPDGFEAPFADIELSSLDDMGVFDNRQSTKSVTTGLNGQAVEEFFDTSFSDSVLVVSISSAEEFYPFVPKIENSKIDVTSPSLWNSRQYLSANLYVPNETGLSLMAMQDDSKINHVYKESFSGESFIAMYRIEAPANLKKGAVSFTLQQAGNDPSQWNDLDVAQSGILNDPSTFGFETHYYYNGLYLIEHGYRNSESFIDQDVRKEFSYVWFDKREKFVKIYTANEPIRPQLPIGIIDISETVDFSKPYWPTFGGVNVNQVSPTVRVTSFHFSSY